jgi:TPR repeat protein
MVHLALLYSSGIGEPRDESETPHRLLLTAAGKGDGEAMLHLSNRYLYGHGEKADLLEAARWRYLAWLQNPRDRFASDRFELLDGQGNPKVEENVPMTEMAEVLSLIVKTVELHDAKSESELRKRYQAAGKSATEVLVELKKFAQDHSLHE